MTALCGGGASHAKSGAGTTILYTASAIAQLLESYKLGWLARLASFLTVASYVADTMCASDPPAMPVFTAQDAQAMLNLSPWEDFLVAVGKVDDVVKHLAWYQFCECNAGNVSPVAPVVPVSPTDVTLVPTATGNAPCGQYSSQVYANQGTLGLATIVFQSGSPNGTTLWGCQPVLVHIHISAWYGSATTPARFLTGWQFYDASNNFVGALTDNVDLGFGPADIDIPVPPGARKVLPRWGSNASPSNVNQKWDMTVTGYAGFNPTSTPCCPSDERVFQMLANLTSLTTLIQRQQVPFAYVHGDSHAGLTGAGHIDVQGLIGCLVTLTTVPNAMGLDVGDPDTIWSESWINWGNADGSTERAFIRTSPQISLPPAAGQFTRIGYSLAPGVVATITELVREP